MRVRVDPELTSLWLMGDARRLGTCLSNFLSNAIKFSKSPEEVGKEIAVTASAQLEAGVCSLRVSVRDYGVGIAPADQVRLFQAFSQIRAGELQQGRGSGLGLAIAREIVQKHGGDQGHRRAIIAESDEFTQASRPKVRLPRWRSWAR